MNANNLAQTNSVTSAGPSVRAKAKNPPYSLNYLPSLVREALGLDVYEKAFLFLLASHQNLKSTRSRKSVEESIGFRGNRIYTVRKQLLGKKLISWTEGRPGSHTVYKLEKLELLRWVANPNAALGKAPEDLAKKKAISQTGMKPHRVGKEGVQQMLRRSRRSSSATTND
ncbi:hypothetical protein [Agreia sp. Leaf283]|uniref:hypothetical protein n=1 Tax=Agreia sp. Leaf283 TaxID=1736321 RepID=UPI000ACCE966|nr:hypothetical protein [Agreia sp. Leaf283]